MLGDAADPAWKRRVEAIPMRGCTVKVNAALHELPNFRARPGTSGDHFLAMSNTPLSLDEWRSYCDIAKRGELPPRVWTEIYFQTAYDPTVAPPGKHTMSVFAQYVPTEFKSGDWNTHRERVGRTVIDSIGRYVTNFPNAVMETEVLGPPDIEERVGLTGGHIFQGEILPQHMWGNRLSPRTPMPGVFLCGAATHPGGSVIAINGRNAAMEILNGV
jgi:phytoene dehydrogenase-like protein